MKHILLALLIPLTASAKLNVVATLPELAAIAREIGGDKVDVTCIGKPGEDPHFIQAKPSFIVTLNKADLLIENGLELEVGWLPALLDQTRNGKIRVGTPGLVVAAEGIPLLEVPTEPVNRAMGDVHPGGNPHFVLDPERGKIIARNICEGYIRVAPQFTDEFRANLAKFNRRVDEALAGWQKILAPYRGAKVVTYHKSLSYLAERFGLVVVNTIEPKPGIPPSPAHLTALIEQMKAEKIKVILTEVWHERRTPNLVAQKTDAKIVELPVPSSGDYLAADDVTVKQLAEALK
jgi:zinc/manganese transport system substrate-binding protein